MPIRSRCAAICYLACLGTVADGAVAADEVKSLPGWKGALPSRHYSGYLPARNGENHVHYYLQLSEGDVVRVNPEDSMRPDYWTVETLGADGADGRIGMVPIEKLTPCSADERAAALQREAEKVERDEKERCVQPMTLSRPPAS